MNQTKSAVAGVLVGGIVGAAAALLLAPKSGKELRAGIQERYASLQDRTSRLVKNASQKTQEIAHEVGHRAERLVDKSS